MRHVSALAFLALFAAAPLCRAADSTGSVFDSHELLEFTVEAPFADLFVKARADEDYSVKGAVKYTDPATGQATTVSGVQISTRGHTSKNASECEFPKLKLKFPESRDNAGPFAGDRTIKIGTHCGDRPDDELTPKFGRLANDKAPHREALVYRLLAEAGGPSLRARPARISYLFLDSPRSDRRPLVRNAMLLEDDDAAGRRLGGVAQLTGDRFESAQAVFNEEDTAALTFAQAMIGNFDWCLRFFPGDTYRCDDTHPLWNVIAIVGKDGSSWPAVYDFDLSGIVVGRHGWFRNVLNEGFSASHSRPELEVLSQLQRTRGLFGRDVLDATRTAFVNKKPALYSAIADSTVDAEGRTLAETYLNSFFSIIADEQAFYSPVIVAADARVYRDAGRAQPACGEASVVPTGTPVSAPVEVSGDMSRVLLLDALWRWAPPHGCTAVRTGPVWVASDAIDTNYPR